MLYACGATDIFLAKINGVNEMIKKIVAVVMTAMMAFSFAACTDKSKTSTDEDNNINNNDTVNEADSGTIELLKQDNKLTQEQLLSRIKAEKLIKNNGYRDSDVVTVMVTMPEKPLVDTFIEGKSAIFQTVAEYAVSPAGEAQAQSITAKQNRLISELKAGGLIESVEHTYNTVINAIAVTAPYGNIEKIKSLSSVEDIILSDTFNRPQAISVDDVNSIVNNVDVYETGIFNSGAIDKDGDGVGDYDGDGTAVAILDSGFDCSHSVFQNSHITKPMYTKSDFGEDFLKTTNAYKTTPNLKAADVYYSDKIPFKYDYADKDSDVFPFDSEHGTHVAGIIGGSDEVITGIAVNTQLVLMKVFPDLQEGAETDDILSALEDATLLGVDAINMSLGSSCGFAREVDKVRINEVYDKLKESGISVITAAGNSYSSGYGGAQGNTNMVTNPDSATVGSPSTYGACLSVASISGVKSKYLIGNDEQVLFFNESNNIAGNPNDFVKELGIAAGETKTYEYITIPGTGLATSYASIKSQVSGRIALIRRGDNTFEEKAQIAKEYGAVACIIYNNIDGDILMSMGKSDHIPTISISKDDGVKLAERNRGTLKISNEQEAGPFMSDFSSWGPTPSLGIKPEITAHGGTIKSAVPGGGYDELSGTSMASPNLCGIVVLIRQYLKDTYPGLNPVEYSKLCNQLLMSTATIVKNQEGNPYSPRKQGAGLASLYNAVTTKAIIEVEGQDRPKLELGDDKKRTGVYTLEFSVRNISSDTLNYTVSLDSMTESVSSSDKNHVAEKAYMLGGDVKVSLESDASTATLSGNSLTVNGNSTAKVKIVYTMSKEDKNYITSSFPYGMYVEGFVRLKAGDEQTEIDLSAPYLSFFGDWTEAPMFDKTYYEVESQAHDGSIDEEDKLKADYYATTPYGSYFYNYIIPLGSYLYDIDTTAFDAIPATEEHIAISDEFGCIDGISAVYAGLLRNAKEMHFTITDRITGEVVYDHFDYNANKAYSMGGEPFPYYEFLKINSYSLGLVNNRQYEFKMQGKLDYGEDGGLSTNVRNTFAFDFYLDNEAPIIKEATYEKVYDRTLKKDRYYITLTVYDNQYVQSISPIAFTSTSSYTYLSDNPVPVYSNRGQDNKVRFEITDYLDALYSQELIGSALCFWIDDYALNSNIYLCQLPGTRGDFAFTSNGEASGRPLNILTAYVGDVIDLTEYLYSSDATLDSDKDYLKYLTWTTYNTSIIKGDPVTREFKNGEAVCLKAGKTQVTVTELMDGKQATITINVKERASSTRSGVSKALTASQTDPVESIEFTYFETKFAYSRAGQTSEIFSTGSKGYISSLNGGISFYPGEKIKLNYEVKPWYVADSYEYEYTSSNESVVKVEQDGTVTALKEGSALVTLEIKGSNLRARLRVTVKSEFVIENRTLVAYKGLGGKVVIPDDEGILYIGSYAFCLYDTDNSVELTEEDYDANKIPAMNTSVTEIVIPDGVEDIQKYAFYNCSGLRSVQLPSSVKFLREYSFYKDVKLEEINLGNVEVIGAHAFHGCEGLQEIDLSKCYTIGASGFEGCSSLERVDLSHLRNAAEENIKVTGGFNRVGRTFKDCTSLSEIVLNKDTKLCREMFVNTGVEEIDIYEENIIPVYCFAKSTKLKKVTIHNSLNYIDMGAFCESPLLETVIFGGSVDYIGSQVFYETPALATFTLPDCKVTIGDYCFKDSGLQTLKLQENTVIESIGASAFDGTKLATFEITGDKNYGVENGGKFLVSKDGTVIILAAQGIDGDITIDAKYEEIASGAFAGTAVTSVKFENESIKIGDYAFNLCEQLTKVEFAGDSAMVGVRAFNACTALTEIVNLDKLKEVGDYAFANTGLKVITLADGADFGTGAFFQSKVTEVTIGRDSTFGMGAFQNCTALVRVNMPADGGVHFGADCFVKDTALTFIDLSKTDGIIEKETFYGCTSLSRAEFGGVTEIGEYAFADCSSLLVVADTHSVKKIGEGAFSRQSQFGSAPVFSMIALNSVEEIGTGAFMGNSGLIEVTLPEGFKVVEGFTFAMCSNLQRVVLPSTVEEIGTYAFRSCENLVSINLENVKTIGDYAFYSAATASTITIKLTAAEKIGTGAFSNTYLYGAIVADNLKELGDNAFSKTYISAFSAPELKKIGTAAFYKSFYLTEFVFGTKLEYVGSYAFLGASSLKTFAYTDNGVRKTSGEINSYASLDGGVLYTKMPSGKIELKSVPAALQITTLTVPEGVVRIDTYAGNRNPNITTIVLPDSLRLIGNYAFNGYSKLATVEFKSYTAPALETEYFIVRNAVERDFFPIAELAEDAPGYGLLHNQFGLFGYELYYFTFKGLAGSFNPIKMILAANSKDGYGGAVYEAYFGKVDKAQRTDYVAMDPDTCDFIEYGSQVAKLTRIVLSDEKVINKAVTALNSMTQKLTDYGYTQEEVDALVKAVRDAKAKLTELQIAAAGRDFKNLLAKLAALDGTFKISMLAELRIIHGEINSLTTEEQILLRETQEYKKYLSLVAQYDEYCAAATAEGDEAADAAVNAFAYGAAAVAVATSLLGAVAFVAKKRLGL